MSRFPNAKKDANLAKLAQSVIENSDIETKCKFNFAYLDMNSPANQFSELTAEKLCEFIDKLKEFTKVPLTDWIKPWEKHNSPLEIYGDFPPKKKTHFEYPIHVPADAKWARFRLSGEARLIGFVIPDELHNKPSENHKNFSFDKNTFYVVFLDLHHQFWISEKKNT